MYSRVCYIKTTCVEEIKNWAQKRGGAPALIKDTNILQIKFPSEDKNNETSSDLEKIDWSEFAKTFANQHCLFMYEDDLKSNFYKLIENAES